jgi:hypothetical protein
MAIVRGHNFQINDLCNAQDLNDLVRLAQISNLGLSDLGGSFPALSALSAPSGAGTGWIAAQHEAPLAAAQGSYTQLSYVITTHSGQVALFNPYGLETRRLYWRGDGDPLLVPGLGFHSRVVGAPNVTLECSIGYSVTGNPIHQFVGSNIGTAASGTALRLRFAGIHGANVVDGGDTIRKYYYFLNAATGQWQHSPGATNTQFVHALALEGTLNGSTTLPAFLFGALLRRA